MSSLSYPLLLPHFYLENEKRVRSGYRYYPTQWERKILVTCPIITVMVNGREFVNRIKAIVLSNFTSLYVYNSSGCYGEILKIIHFYHFDSDPRFTPFLLYVRWKSGVTFVRICFRDV